MSTNNKISELIFTGNDIENFKFRVVESKVVERLDYPFMADCICYYEGVTNSPYNLGVDNLVDRNIRLYLYDPSYTNNKSRILQNKLFIGVVSEVIYLGSKELPKNFSTTNRYYYRFKLSSQLMRLSYNRAYRIYNNKSVLEVLKHLFERSRGPITVQVDFSRIQNEFKQEDYISQYNESDLDFLLRLCSRYGIYISESEKGINFYDSVYKADFTDSDNKQENEEVSKHVTYPYNPASDNYLSSHCISSIERGTSGRNLWSIFSTSDTGIPSRQNLGISQNYWEERQVDNRDKITTYAKNISNYHPSFTNINYQNGLQFQATLDTLSSHVEAVKIKATSNILDINTNDALTITNIEGKDETYKVIGIEHYYQDKSEQGGRILEREPALYSMYSNSLHLIPNTMPYAMPVIDKPRALGITTGVVIGNSEDIESERNTIVVDEYGRVRVQFASSVVQGRYDEEVFSGKYSFTHSCYLRYASPVSSNHSGFIAVPRVGDEVVISFIDGDPDKPIITGSLYNQENPSLIQSDIKSNKHKTSLTSKTVGKGEQGRNELTMSNMPGREQVYLKAEKDYEELVQHDYNQTILNNKTSSVTGSHTENILQAHIQNIAGLKDVNVGGEYLTVVALSKDTAVGLSNTLNVGASNKLRVAENSSESVGGNKDVNVSGDYTVSVDGEYERIISGNLDDRVLGSIDITSEAGINISSDNYYNMTVDTDIDIYAQRNTTMQSKRHLSLYSSSADMQFTHLDLITDDMLSLYSKGNFQIKISDDISITSDGSNIIFQIKDMKVVFNENGIGINNGSLSIKK